MDNIVIYQEALHTMRVKKGNMGYMILKIDLEKVYDRLSWSFIRQTLQEVGLNQRWIDNIMTCVETSRLAILWNGRQLDWIKPERGIRQGDPISPYLFVLCIKRLSHLIKAEVANHNWRGVKLSRYGLEISHLLFADDMILFAEATGDQIQTVRRCLDKFEAISGQRVSLQKSQIHFSRNVKPEVARKISQIAGIEQTDDLGKYLGVPSIHRRISASLFTPMIENWKDGKISTCRWLVEGSLHKVSSTLYPTMPCKRSSFR